MKIIFATGNMGKLAEASEILGQGFELVTPAQMGITEEIPETGDTLRANSFQKAEYIYKKTGHDCFADDSGLEVDALGGAPGVYSARYAGDHCSFDDNIEKLLGELEKHPGEPRTARFRTVVTLLIGGEAHYFDGAVEGKIAFERSGTRGFGYDPIFVPDAFAPKTFSEIGVEEKNAISHRGQCLRAMAAWMAENL